MEFVQLSVTVLVEPLHEVVEDSEKAPGWLVEEQSGEVAPTVFEVTVPEAVCATT